ncbi:MAG: O-antigen ligase family protein, partial [Candidatus Wallbacteria bacterium]|nr:O-antigen ligase family protein [Candidatus Wallbacteria bacterium]
MFFWKTWMPWTGRFFHFNCPLVLPCLILVLPFLRTIDPNEAWQFKTGIAGMICGILILNLILRKKNILIPHPGISGPLLMLIAWQSVRAAFSQVPAYALQGLNESILFVLLIIASACSGKGRDLTLRVIRLQAWIFFPAFFAVYLRLPQLFAGYWQFGSLPRMVPGIDPNGFFFFYNQNFCAAFVVLSALYLFLNGERLLPALQIILLCFLGNRAALVTIPVVLLSISAVKSGFSKKHFFTVLIAGLLFVTAVTAFSAGIKSFPSFEHRLIMWKTSFSMFRHAPFSGFGEGGFSVQYPFFGREFLAINDTYNLTLYPHNDFLEILTENGIPGLALLLFIYWRIFSRTRLETAAMFLAAGIFSLFSMPRHMAMVILTLAVVLADD